MLEVKGADQLQREQTEAKEEKIKADREVQSSRITDNLAQHVLKLSLIHI